MGSKVNWFAHKNMPTEIEAEVDGRVDPAGSGNRSDGGRPTSRRYIGVENRGQLLHHRRSFALKRHGVEPLVGDDGEQSPRADGEDDDVAGGALGDHAAQGPDPVCSAMRLPTPSVAAARAATDSAWTLSTSAATSRPSAVERTLSETPITLSRSKARTSTRGVADERACMISVPAFTEG